LNIREFKSYLVKEINTPNSEWNKLINKYKLDLVITGKVIDSYDYENKEAVIYFITSETGEIKEVKIYFVPGEVDNLTWHEKRTEFYKNVYEKVLVLIIHKFYNE
jgi:hypothetical protein